MKRSIQIVAAIVTTFLVLGTPPQPALAGGYGYGYGHGGHGGGYYGGYGHGYYGHSTYYGGGLLYGLLSIPAHVVGAVFGYPYQSHHVEYVRTDVPAGTYDSPSGADRGGGPRTQGRSNDRGGYGGGTAPPAPDSGGAGDKPAPNNR